MYYILLTDTTNFNKQFNFKLHLATSQPQPPSLSHTNLNYLNYEFILSSPRTDSYYILSKIAKVRIT
jgi:hypothetical protein